MRKFKSILKLILFILPWLIIAYIIYFLTYRHDVVDKNGHSINHRLFKNKFLEKDGIYIFHKDAYGKTVEIVKVDSLKKIIKLRKEKNSLLEVESAYDSKLKFSFVLKDSLKPDLFEFNNINKIISVSDIEGNFKLFSDFLINNKIIDKDFNWKFGNGHLVCNGDFFDRGDDVTACLWLIYKLEQDAEKHGGKVHFIIGNHEEMNLRGVERYTDLKYSTLAVKLKIPYKELYGKKSELGEWLRTKNSIIKINNILFTHGGLSPDLVDKKYSIEEINKITQKYIGEDNDYLKFINPRASFIFERKGPMWYRGYFGDYKEYYKEIKNDELNKILNYYNVKHIVVGHTIVDRVKTLFNDKIIAIDVTPKKVDEESASVLCEGLYIENNSFYRTFSNGNRELLINKKQ